MELETNIKTIEVLAKERDEENWTFRTFLKNRSDDRLERRAHRIQAEVSAAIDCTQCGNCCAVLSPTVSPEDVARLAPAVGMNAAAFRDKYVETTECGEDAIAGRPCPFLKDKKCTVYEHRPEECREYPHLHKEGFSFRLIGVITNYGICPIVFNTVELLKQEMGFQNNGGQ